MSVLPKELDGFFHRVDRTEHLSKFYWSNREGSNALVRKATGHKKACMKIAAVTMSFEEPLFLPIWIRHYGSRLGYENLFIIDDSANRDLCDTYPGLNIVRRPHRPFDEDERALYISMFHEALLKRYDAAIFADTDELLQPDPKLGLSLSDYVMRELTDHVAATGFNVLHNHFSEPAIDENKPLFRQRHFVQFDIDYCKTLLSRVPMRWTPGFHGSQHRKKIDSGLLLFHLRAVDIAQARNRILVLNRIDMSENMVRNNRGVQFRLDADSYIQSLFPMFDLETISAHPDLLVDDLKAKPSVDSTDRFQFQIYRVPERFHDSIKLLSQGDPIPEIDTGSSKADWAQKLFDDCYWSAVSELSKGSRNSHCPCGSGKRFKHCHGALS